MYGVCTECTGASVRAPPLSRLPVRLCTLCYEQGYLVTAVLQPWLLCLCLFLRTRISFGASAGRTFLSAQLFKEMTVRRLQKANLEMLLFVDGKLQKYVCRVKTPEMADSLKVTLDKYKPK